MIFDCNVYLDAACLLGPPFTWDGFNQKVASCARESFPHPLPAVDSLRALALCTSGKFAGNEVLEVWTSQHITETVVYKARQAATPDPMSGFFGLGWSRSDANSLLDLIGDLATMSDGGDVGRQFPDGNPPLDHEDGLVYGACRYLAGQDPLCNVYCVTRDRGFLNAGQDPRFPRHTRVLNPRQFVGLVRAARSRLAMPPPPGFVSPST